MRATLVAVLFLVAPLAGCLSDASVQDIEQPVWSSGYAWSWNTTGVQLQILHAHFEGEDPVRIDTERPIDPVVEVVEVLNTSMVVQGVPLYVAGYWNSQTAASRPASQQCVEVSSGGQNRQQCFTVPGVSGTQLVGVRPSDLSYIPLHYGVMRQCQNNVCRTELSDLGSARPPEYPFLDFPLNSGKSWGGPMAESVGGDSGLEWEYQARVVGQRTVQTELGPLDTVRVEIVKRPTNLADYRREIVEEAQSEGVRVDRFDYDVSWRRVAYYSQELETVVYSTFDYTESVVAAGRFEGSTFDFRSREALQLETVLTGAELFTKPERDRTYMARVAAGEIGISDPAGNLPDPRRVQISIGHDVMNVNAFAGETATFTARITDSTTQGEGNGTDAAPLEVRWRILDYLQRPVAGGSGESFGHAFDAPGLYAIQADAIDSATGRVLASHQMPFEAYYDRTFRWSELVATSFLMAPQPVPFPIRPGVLSLEVTATPQSPTDPLHVNRVQVRDATGQVVTDERGGADRFRVTVRDFSPYFLDDASWDVRWFIQGGYSVAEDIEFRIHQRYAEDGAGDPHANHLRELAGIPGLGRLVGDGSPPTIVGLIG